MSIFIDFDIEIKDLKFKVADHVRISKQKIIFAKGYPLANWLEDVFVIEKFKDTFPWTCIISNLDGQEIVETFYEKRTAKSKLKRVQS